MSSACDYYKAKNLKDIINCPNCTQWSGRKCNIEDQVKRNDKTDLVHESIRGGCRSGRVTGVLR
jgi:hypothetical protein